MDSAATTRSPGPRIGAATETTGAGVRRYTGAALASGIITGEEGETFTAGDLGEYEVGADGVVILGPPTRFNADNIDDFDF